MKSSTIAIISTAVIASFGIAYLIHYDNKRRSDPNYKKQKKRERRKLAKEEKKNKEKEVENVESLVQNVLNVVDKETFPEAAEAKEAYFMENVAAGEGLIKEGKEMESVAYFYKALKIYPAPLELIMIYQKTLPENVFRIVVNIMALEQQRRQTQFYDEFPPKELGLKLQQVVNEPKENEKELYGLVAEKDFEKDVEMYHETPLISALLPELEGSYCNYCMKSLTKDNKVVCENCDRVAFCSAACQKKGSEQYHQFLCTNNKVTVDEKAQTFLTYVQDNHVLYPQMIAQFLSSMVAEEIEKNRLGKDAPKYSAWDHIERFKQTNMEESDIHLKETTMIKDLLMSKVPGIDEFLSTEIYLVLKGKLSANTFQVPGHSQEEQKMSLEPVHRLSKNPGLGDAMYKISSYLQQAQSEEDANVKIEFKDHVIAIKTTKDIHTGDALKAYYE